MSHLFGSTLGLIFAIFGSFALGACLARSRAGRLKSVAVVITVLGSALFMPGMGVYTFAVPEEGQAYLAEMEEFSKLPTSFADTSLLVVLLLLVGYVLIGVAVWRSGALPMWAGVHWAAAAVLKCPLDIVYAATIGSQSTRRRCPLARCCWSRAGVEGLERPAPTFRRGDGRPSSTEGEIANPAASTFGIFTLLPLCRVCGPSSVEPGEPWKRTFSETISSARYHRFQISL